MERVWSEEGPITRVGLAQKTWKLCHFLTQLTTFSLHFSISTSPFTIFVLLSPSTDWVILGFADEILLVLLCLLTLLALLREDLAPSDVRDFGLFCFFLDFSPKPPFGDLRSIILESFRSTVGLLTLVLS